MGDPRSVPEIGAAVELLEEWEKALADPGAADLFAQALEQLDDYVEAEPDTPHRTFIDNLRRSNLRRLLSQISRVRASDLGNWAGYSVVLTSRREVGALVGEQPELKAGLDAFVDAHR